MAASVSMNSERARLETFNDRPQWNHCLMKGDLARYGLFATGHSSLETQCNWCHHNYNNWEDAYRYYNTYRNNMPYLPLETVGHTSNCSFLLNPETSGNIPLTSDSTDQQTNPSPLFLEANRLATYTNWPNSNISPMSLAKAGFYYLQRGDEVKCVWCGGIIAKWEKQDNAFDEHKRFFPDCPRVQLGPLVEFTNSELRELGIQLPTPPKTPKYSSLDTRLRTFSKWPISHIQKPDALAQAGLYYQDIDDQVRCFHCNIGLRSWQKEDDPWFEHAKWYPKCQFVQLAKGNTYVNNVQELVSKSANRSEPAMSINDAMSMPIAREALAIGIDGGLLRAVIQRRLQITGVPYNDLDELVQAAFEPDGLDEFNRLASFMNDAGTTAPTITPSPVQLLVDTPQCSSATSPTTAADLSNKPVVQSTPASSGAETNNCNQNSVKDEDTLPAKVALEEENRQLKDARLCKVCLDEEVGVVFLPCGHLVTCLQCAPGVNQCPMCRSNIKGFVRTFLA